jgi:hypothetical protein
MFTAVGSPAVTGYPTNTTAPSTVTLNTVTGLVPLEPLIITGNTSSAGGLANGTYYIVAVNSGNNTVTLASSLANAQAGTAITNFTTSSSFAGVIFNAGGPDSNITFTYNPTAQTISANVSIAQVGILSVSQDTSPLLGGNLGLNNYNIVGTGAINITGNITNTGTISNTGSIGTSGAITAASANITGTMAASAITGPSTSNTIVSQSNNIYPSDLYVATTGQSSGTPTWRMLSARGSVASPTAVQAGDQIGSLGWFGWVNGGWTETAGINASFDATANMSYANPASNIAIGVNNSSNGFVALKFNYQGVLSAPSVSYGLEIPLANYITVNGTNTYVLSATDTYNVLLVNSTGYTATLTFPSTGLIDGQQLRIVVTTNTVTLALTAGPTLVGTFAGSVGAPTTITYIYRASNTTWYRVA